MAHDHSNDDSGSDSSTEPTGTLPQVGEIPSAPASFGSQPQPIDDGPSALDVQFHSQTLISNQPAEISECRAPSEAVPDESQPFMDSPTGTVVGPSDFTGQITALPHHSINTSHDALLGGRFTILNELAKGGMGQVCIALDRELDRTVALKEIQPRYAYDRSVAARFLLEARVTGKLEHPGIVPVYGLNHYPDGRPYYAMRFITGESLQDAVKAFHQADTPDRDPQERALALRKLLKRFTDVCNTIAYAHSRGILHRDLKPANVMLGAFGETLVVDWGLAKDTTVAPKSTTDTTQIIPALARERIVPSMPLTASSPRPVVHELESLAFDATRTGIPKDAQPAPAELSAPLDSHDVTRTGIQIEQHAEASSKSATPPHAYNSELTEFGKAMGTPAYMAPEQADGRWDSVGKAADIYSLGATLYTILCGKAPFRGDAYEILERVKRGEMIPIHEHKAGIPLPLVAIVKKAMALRPDDRYQTALELANDVERWMADEPIAIYREPWTVRAARWARRHRNIVLGSTAVMITAITALSIGYVQVNAEQKKTAEAKSQTELAYELLKEEERKVRESFEKLQEEERKVRLARSVAERNRENARTALLALTDDAIGEILTSQHAATGKQKQFLEHVVEMYRRFIEESSDQNDSKFFVAGAHFRVGRLQFKLGNHQEAAQAYQQVFALATDQNTSEWKQLRGETLIYSGIQQMARGLPAEAERQFRNARQIFFELITEDEQAKRPANPEYWHRLAQAEDRLGLALYNLGNLYEAEDWFRNSLTNRRTLFAMQPGEPEYEFRIAQSLRQIAMVCNADGRRLEALENANEARTICTRLLKSDPTSAVYLVQLADIDNLLTIASTDHRFAQGEARYAEPARPRAKRLKDKLPAMPIAKLPPRTVSARHADDAVQNWSRLVNLYPSDVGYRQQLAVAQLNLAVAEQSAGRLRAASDALASTTLVLDDLERRFAADSTTTMLRGRVAHAQAVNYREKDELEKAESEATIAITLTNRLLREQPENPRHRSDLALYQIELATILLLREKLVPAEQSLGEAWINTELAARAPGVSRADTRIWSNIRDYSRTYADLLAELGRYDQMAVVVQRIDALGTWPDAAKYHGACLLGRAAILATRDARLGLDEQKRMAVDFAEKSLDRLESIERGFDWLNSINNDPDLLAVRSLPEFADVVKGFREPAPPPRIK